LPESLKSQYAALWTPKRMQRVIQAAVQNHVAIEINSHFRIPSATFIRQAKSAGAKFSFGSNEHVHGIGNIEYPLAVARECGLSAADIYVPARRLPGVKK
jgi:histidinol phosphatase-like PHP family hydrolase